MSTLALLVAGLFTLGPLLLAGAALLDALRPRRGVARRGWQAALIVSLMTLPVVPGIPVASAPRERVLEGPDLLSGTPLIRTAAPDRTRMFGLIRTETERETQGGRLLREVSRDVVTLPFLPLLLGLGWFRRAWSDRTDTDGVPA